MDPVVKGMLLLCLYLLVALFTMLFGIWTLFGFLRVVYFIFRKFGGKVREVAVMAVPGQVKDFWEEIFEEIPEPPKEVHWVDRAVELYQLYIPQEWWKTAIMVIAALILTYWIFKLLRIVLGVYVERFLFSLRGIQYESVRVGSALRSKTDPCYQVSIVDIGIFSTVHVGHGIRMGGYLVVPNHVRDAVKGTPGLTKNGKTIAISWVGVNSMIFSDIYYAVIDSKIWSQLGVTTAPKASSIRQVMSASVSSNGEGSEGIVQPQRTPGWLTYSGSTLPGYSGAAYYTTTNLVGLHTGSMVIGNVGVAAIVVQAEIGKICRRESAAPEEYEDRFDKYHEDNHWEKDQNVHQWVDDTYKNSQGFDFDEDRGFTDYDNVNYTTKAQKRFKETERQRNKITAMIGKLRNWESASDSKKNVFEDMSRSEMDELVVQLEVSLANAKAAKAMKNLQAAKIVDGQTREGGEIELTVQTTPLSALSRRVDILERTVLGITEIIGQIRVEAAPVVVKPQQPKDKIVCKICSKEFRQRKFLSQHFNDAHAVKTESAWPSDAKKVVKTTKQAAFLGKSSPAKTGEPSVTTSSTVERTDQFLELLENQRSTQLLMKQMLRVLEKFSAPTAGPSSATMPN